MLTVVSKDNLSILVIQATMERASSDFGHCLKLHSVPPGLEIWGGTRLRASMASPPMEQSRSLAMEESTLSWPTDKEHEEMAEVCSIGEVPHTEKSG